MTKERMNDIQDKIIDDVQPFSDWFDLYQYILDRGKKLEPMDESLKTEDHLINGCQSQVWLTGMMRDQTVEFQADSDSLLIKGLISLVFEVINHQTPQDISSVDLYVIDSIGLTSHLSPSRSIGLQAILQKIKFITNQYLNSPLS